MVLMLSASAIQLIAISKDANSVLQPYIPLKSMPTAVFYLSLAISFVTGILIMLKPEVMWKTCKSTQLEMESELYKFRCEFGE